MNYDEDKDDDFKMGREEDEPLDIPEDTPDIDDDNDPENSYH